MDITFPGEKTGKGLEVTVSPYLFDARQNKFVPDAYRYNSQQGQPFFTIAMPTPVQPDEATTGSQRPVELRLPGKYKSWIKEYHSRLSLDQLAKRGEAVVISLPEVYIPLATANPFYKGEKENSLLEEGDEETGKQEPSLLDIETLIGREGIDCLLLRGAAGMGKTTLVKHLAYTIAWEEPPQGLQGYLPVLVFLRSVWPIYQAAVSAASNVSGKVTSPSFDNILAAYLKKENCPLSIDVVGDYLAQGRALFLFDGLDEIPDTCRGDVVEMLRSFCFHHRDQEKGQGNRFLFTGRPHGYSAPVLERLGDNIRDIENLDQKQVESFIQKWYGAVAREARGFAGQFSQDLSKELLHHAQDNEGLALFTQNPLLLTGVCVLYLVAGKKIPDQRAELYDRIVENLIYRRFHDLSRPNLEKEVKEYLMELAFFMHHERLKSIDVHEAKKILKRVIEDTRKQPVNKSNLDKFFDEIEPDCGLLNRLSSGEVEFYHLSFQEFLTAKYLLDRDTDISNYLEDPWWEESILLYSGLMNMDMGKRSNTLVKELLARPAKIEGKEVYCQLLGAKALRDFDPLKREKQNITLATGKLLGIIENEPDVKNRIEAGDLLGILGDPRSERPGENMVYIPAGEFIRGSDAADADDRERPVRKIFLDAYEIGKYPVTNTEYRKFIEAGGYEKKEYWSPNGWEWRVKEKITAPEYWYNRKNNGANVPVVGVSWYEASAYAKWLSEESGQSYRLPTETEWERAARGTGGRAYPWGNDFDKEKCNSGELGLMRTSPVGIFPTGKSPEGCFDMAGNVWEWCSDWYSSTYYKDSPSKNPGGPPNGGSRVLRGGSWFLDAVNCRAACRGWFHPSYRGFVGVRLLRELF